MGLSDYSRDDDVIDLDTIDLSEPPAPPSERRTLSDRLVRARTVDDLTGLENRRGLTCALFDMDRPEREFAIGVIDIDGFGDVNRRHGLLVGDLLLVMIAERLVAAAPDDASIFRPDGNEFVVVVPRAVTGEELADLAQSLMAAVTAPLDLVDGPRSLTASMGWATTPAGSPVQVLSQADAAMYRSKRAGGGRIHTQQNFDAIW